MSKTRNPILTPGDVALHRAAMVADPFMLRKNGTWHLFCEVMAKKSGGGYIGHALSKDGFTWTKIFPVIQEPFHLSYPYVFEWKRKIYLVPESHEDKAVNLYVAEKFPRQWKRQATLLRGRPFADAAPFFAFGRWWMLVTDAPFWGKWKLRLYASRHLEGPWHEHPKSPITNCKHPRNAGRIIKANGRLFRLAQEDRPLYGSGVSLYEITHLTTTEYQERLVTSHLFHGDGKGWNASGMHHLDAHQIGPDRWFACVDGCTWGSRQG